MIPYDDRPAGCLRVLSGTQGVCDHKSVTQFFAQRNKPQKDEGEFMKPFSNKKIE
ncbi:MAG: hypothetical protein QM667_01815 [Asticcacaulis sp.]